MEWCRLALATAVLLLALISSSIAILSVPIERKSKSLAQYRALARSHVESFSSRVARSSEEEFPRPPYFQAITAISSDFCTNISIGTPPQNFSVIVRTDTTGLWIPSALCPVDQYDMCKNHRRYDRSLSRSYMREGQMMGYGGMIAETSFDTLVFGEQCIRGQSFAEVLSYSYSDTGILYDGLLGIDSVQHYFSNDKSIFVNMLEQGLIKSIIYGLYFVKNPIDTSRAGELVIGGRNSSAYKGDLAYVPNTQEYMWEFTIDGVFLEYGHSPLICPQGCPGRPSSGSHFIMGDQNDLKLLHRGLGAIEFLDDYTYHFNCSSLHTLQPVIFSIGQTLFKVPWQSYVDRLVGDDGKEVCRSSFIGAKDSFGSGFGLGDAFFSSVYVEFDPDKRQIGFAQLAST